MNNRNLIKFFGLLFGSYPREYYLEYGIEISAIEKDTETYEELVS